MAGIRAAVEALGADRPAILRKDFIIDEYQVLEARVHGADSLLLIVASLDDTKLCRLMERSRSLGMEPLVEVSNADEIDRAVAAGARVIGINNRDLRNFRVDLGTTDRLASRVGGGVLLAALSGISTREDVLRFQAAGAGAAAFWAHSGAAAASIPSTHACPMGREAVMRKLSAMSQAGHGQSRAALRFFTVAGL